MRISQMLDFETGVLTLKTIETLGMTKRVATF